MEYYFLDTCIWRDFYEDRTSKKGMPLGEYASKLFSKIISSKKKIIFSETLYWELKKDYSLEEINNLLFFLKVLKVLNKVEINKHEYLEAKKLSDSRKIPFVDCLNAVLARNNGALLITQDKHFFENLSDIAKCKRPQEVI